MSSRDKNPQLYIRGFSRRTTRDDLKDAFRKYGKIREVQLKNGYAFIEYDDYYDAEEAADRMHGKSLDGYRLTVEPAGRDRRRGSSRNRDGGGRRGP